MIKLSFQYYPDDLQHPDNQDFKRMRLREISSAINTLREQITAVGENITEVYLVSPSDFFDGKWLSADQKRKILKQWTSFIKNGFPENLFTNAIYEHLHLHCGYIAHYDRSGFYVEYWGAHARDLHRHAKEDAFILRSIPTAFYNWKSFLRQFTTWGEYRDINTAMMAVLKSELEVLLKDLIAEAHYHFEADNNSSYQLFLSEKQAIFARIHSLRKEADELEVKLASFTQDGHRSALERKYQQLFGEDFSVSTPAVSHQLSLI